jgi:hypothetical protein
MLAGLTFGVGACIVKKVSKKSLDTLDTEY